MGLYSTALLGLRHGGFYDVTMDIYLDTRLCTRAGFYFSSSGFQLSSVQFHGYDLFPFLNVLSFSFSFSHISFHLDGRRAHHSG